GGMIPVAVGAALSYSMNKQSRIAVVFLGDAAVEEGAFLESVNFAMLKKLPVLFVCENNLFSTHTHIKYRQPESSVYGRIKGFGLISEAIDGNDSLKVYEIAGKLISDARSGKGPAFMECFTYRHREHVGPDFDYQNPYRTKEEVESWIQKCPIKRLQEYLLKENIFSLKNVDEEKQKINKEIDAAMDFAHNSKWPSSDELLKYVY
ncbi:MAG: thiamine pyrophosphate-dependent dehydrogenase E1 component subunit alpha, partial [Candidatus Omnitrophota bacterium]